MRVSVDARLCSGQGRCYVLSPGLFTSDDDGFCAERGTTRVVPAGQEAAAQLAVDSCPEGAIALVSSAGQDEPASAER
jgi:ferredoxin